mmetsp:Transcript_32661/g.76165  ORF Transcript_32661/g.76165 Transcript_32661/m.76165 type:complete len:303 (+) Transcript_32661:1358-2266(+)
MHRRRVGAHVSSIRRDSSSSSASSFCARASAVRCAKSECARCERCALSRASWTASEAACTERSLPSPLPPPQSPSSSRGANSSTTAEWFDAASASPPPSTRTRSVATCGTLSQPSMSECSSSSTLLGSAEAKRSDADEVLAEGGSRTRTFGSRCDTPPIDTCRIVTAVSCQCARSRLSCARTSSSRSCAARSVRAPARSFSEAARSCVAFRWCWTAGASIARASAGMRAISCAGTSCLRTRSICSKRMSASASAVAMASFTAASFCAAANLASALSRWDALLITEAVSDAHSLPPPSSPSLS